LRSESILSAVVLLLSALLAGCSAGGGASTGGTSASAGATGGFTAGVSSGASSVRQGSSTGGTSGQQATLRLSGTPGVAFSGRCTVGSRTETLEGKTPAVYTYELGGRQLECQIHRQSTGGTLEVTFEAPGSHATQRMNSPNGTLEITYRDGSLSVSQTSKSH